MEQPRTYAIALDDLVNRLRAMIEWAYIRDKESYRFLPDYLYFADFAFDPYPGELMHYIRFTEVRSNREAKRATLEVYGVEDGTEFPSGENRIERPLYTFDLVANGDVATTVFSNSGHDWCSISDFGKRTMAEVEHHDRMQADDYSEQAREYARRIGREDFGDSESSRLVRLLQRQIVADLADRVPYESIGGRDRARVSKPIVVASNARFAALLLFLHIHQDYIKTQREFVVPYQGHTTFWDDEWSDPNDLPPNGTIALVRCERDEQEDQTSVRVFGVHRVERYGLHSSIQEAPIADPLYVFGLVDMQGGGVEVRYIANVDRHSHSMQHYPQEMLEQLKEHFGDARSQNRVAEESNGPVLAVEDSTDWEAIELSALEEESRVPVDFSVQAVPRPREFTRHRAEAIMAEKKRDPRLSQVQVLLALNKRLGIEPQLREKLGMEIGEYLKEHDITNALKAMRRAEGDKWAWRTGERN